MAVRERDVQDKRNKPRVVAVLLSQTAAALKP